MRKSRRASSVVHCLQLLPLIDGRCAGCDGRDAEDESFLRTLDRRRAPRQLSLLCYCMLRSANSLLHCAARRECTSTSLCSACFVASSVCVCLGSCGGCLLVILSSIFFASYSQSSLCYSSIFILRGASKSRYSIMA